MAEKIYYVAEDTKGLKEKLLQGAKLTGKGLSNKDRRLLFVSSLELAEKLSDLYVKKNSGAVPLIVGVSVEKDDIVYPEWKMNFGNSKGLFALLVKHADYLNNHAKNIHIPITNPTFGWGFSEITGIKYRKNKRPEAHEIIFSGIDIENNKTQVLISRFDKCIQNDGTSSFDSIKLEPVFNYLCQTSPEFQSDYNQLMQDTASQGLGSILEYCGEKELPVVELSRYWTNQFDKATRDVLYPKKPYDSYSSRDLMFEMMNRKRDGRK